MNIRTWFSRLSTAVKMFIILGLALFPLGFVAILASVDAARDGYADRVDLAKTAAVESAAALDALVARDALALRVVLASASLPGSASSACALASRLPKLEPGLSLKRIDLFGSDARPLCGGAALARASDDPTVLGITHIDLDVPGRALSMSIRTDALSARAAIDVGSFRNIGATSSREQAIDLRLDDGERQVEVVDRYEPKALQQTVVSRARIADSNVFAVASVGANPISAVEIVSILLPLVMWLAAAMLGWLIVDRLLLRPIVRMQQAVLSYAPGGAPVEVPELLTPATEIRDLGVAFARVTNIVAIHEAELEAAIARQARLVREVHHRVKNNLQVVASLLNLHARGAKSADAANAYATIQRRVDALAVVHRNHFAELEDDRGVALRPLLSELTGNLRATAPETARGMNILLDLDAAYVNQDVAVSVAFFVTEVVEHAMMCTPHEPVGVTLRQSPSPTVARLILSSASLKSDAPCGNVDVRQFERITTGLSRQLRAVLERDVEIGLFGIDIAVQAGRSPA